ncbi:uncharacterized protein LOC119243609 [Talpa occidentalis]|uniref:uncharacterized protein LOC119243609 n=1 Tax=Talpa occidentalis TaxID=50954 RepID=UPI0023F727D0|nr:uncharacterized protein LOC119243609 [Talpa occidentalis]
MECENLEVQSQNHHSFPQCKDYEQCSRSSASRAPFYYQWTGVVGVKRPFVKRPQLMLTASLEQPRDEQEEDPCEFLSEQGQSILFSGFHHSCPDVFSQCNVTDFKVIWDKLNSIIWGTGGPVSKVNHSSDFLTLDKFFSLRNHVPFFSPELRGFHLRGQLTRHRTGMRPFSLLRFTGRTDNSVRKNSLYKRTVLTAPSRIYCLLQT